ATTDFNDRSAVHDWPPLSRRLVLGEDLLDALEGLLDRDFGLHAFLGHVDHRHAPDVLASDFGHRQVEDEVFRHRRTEDTLLDVAAQMWVFRILPEWALGECRLRRQVPAQPRLDELAEDLWLDDVLAEFFRDRDVLRALRDQKLVETDDTRH